MPKIDSIDKEPSLNIEPTMPSNPALRAVVDDVLAKLRYSLAVVAAEEQPAAHGSLDVMFREFLATRSAPTRARYRERSQALHAATPELRATNFGRYAAINPKEYSTLGSDGVTSRVGKLAVDPKALEVGFRNFQPQLSGLRVPIATTTAVGHQAAAVPLHVDKDAIDGLAFKKMRLFINKVRCVEETDEWGSDEINMGGIVIDPFGNTSLITEFEVSDDFDEGELVDFGVSKVFATWNLVTQSPGFPYVYSAIIALSEKDDGGFYKFLNDLWQKVKTEVTKEVADAVGAAIGGAIGNVLGAIAGYVVAAFVECLINLFDNHDDIVGTIPIWMTLASSKKSYYDWAKLTSPEGWKYTLHFKGDGGYYRVAISFKVFTQ